MHFSRPKLLSLGALVLAAPLANAAIVSVTGDFVIGSVPDVQSFTSTPTDQLLIWNEQQGVTLGSDIALDQTASGWTPPTSVVPGVATAGTVVDSHFLFIDPQDPQVAIFSNGTVTFDKKILGVEFRVGGLNDSNSLGLGSITYGTFSGLDGLEIPGLDSFAISADRYTFSFSNRAILPGDRVRIITSDAVPEPMSLFALTFAIPALLKRRRALIG